MGKAYKKLYQDALKKIDDLQAQIFELQASKREMFKSMQQLQADKEALIDEKGAKEIHQQMIDNENQL